MENSQLEQFKTMLESASEDYTEIKNEKEEIINIESNGVYFSFDSITGELLSIENDGDNFEENYYELEI